MIDISSSNSNLNLNSNNHVFVGNNNIDIDIDIDIDIINKIKLPQHRIAQVNDIVTIDLELIPEDGFVPEPLFDTSGKITLMLGKGNYLPGLHSLLTATMIGEEIRNVSVDAGWGARNPDLIIDVPKSNFERVECIDSIKVGSILNLKRGFKVSVIKVTDDTITVDANHPFAGSSYLCSLTVLNIESFPWSKLVYQDNDENTKFASSSVPSSSKYEVSTWALGCFWGGELAFMRVPGVVGTRVGYTQGNKVNPTTEDIKSGSTKHREAILVIYDPAVVSYKKLTSIYMERLAATTNQYKMEPSTSNEAEQGRSDLYRHGIYYHNDEQREIAQSVIQEKQNIYNIELKRATKFYDADEYHQQHLLKGGQTAQKNARVPIRCYG